MQLKFINHINFNIQSIFYQNNIYIYPGVYYYAQFNAHNLKNLMQALLLPDTYTFSDRIIYNPQTYKQWADNHPDQKWAQHNFKIDKEDLAKIGIEA
jgi:hypothetical protein